MKCPLCGKEMETCFLESNSFLYLTRKLHPFMGPVFAPGCDKIAKPAARRVFTTDQDTRNEVSREVFFCPFSFSKEKGESLPVRRRSAPCLFREK